MKKIVLVGAGFGCLSVLKSLDKSMFDKYSFTLISDNSYHYHTTLLHQFASNTNSKLIHPLSNILHPKIQLIQSSVVSIDENMLTTKDDQISFDYLILGVGSQKNTFGIPGFDSANDIGNIHSATKVANELKSSLFSASKLDKSVIICGAGLTGVELAGSLADYARLHAIDANIMLVEAFEHILPPFDSAMASYAKSVLEANGVSVYESAKIIQGNQDSILIEQNTNTQELKATNIIWTAGVKGNELISKTPFQSQNNRVLVDEYCRPKSHPNGNIYVIGDCCAMIDPSSQRPYPPTAQFAQKQGEYIASILPSLLQGNTQQAKFSYTSKGTVCSLCDGKAVGQVGDKAIYGAKANMIKKLIDKKWLFKLYGLKALFI